jgi:hypothetical protein
MLQRGVFTVVVSHGRPGGPIDRRELHETLYDFAREKKNLVHARPPVFFSLYLPVSESPKLLLLLSQLGYSANRIYNGFPGAAKAVREHADLFGHL